MSLEVLPTTAPSPLRAAQRGHKSRQEGPGLESYEVVWGTWLLGAAPRESIPGSALSTHPHRMLREVLSSSVICYSQNLKVGTFPISQMRTMRLNEAKDWKLPGTWKPCAETSLHTLPGLQDRPSPCLAMRPGPSEEWGAGCWSTAERRQHRAIRTHRRAWATGSGREGWAGQPGWGFPATAAARPGLVPTLWTALHGSSRGPLTSLPRVTVPGIQSMDIPHANFVSGLMLGQEPQCGAPAR